MAHEVHLILTFEVDPIPATKGHIASMVDNYFTPKGVPMKRYRTVRGGADVLETTHIRIAEEDEFNNF